MIKQQRYVREMAQPKRRIVPLAFGVVVIFGLLVLRLWYLQILYAEDYRALSENNRLRFLPVPASRGALMDRNGTVLVSNRPSFSLTLIPQEIKDVEAMLDRLASLLGLDRAELGERWQKAKGRARYYPVVVAANITREQVEIVEENRQRLSGVEVAVKPVREYNYQQSSAHLLGYIAEISEKELDETAYQDYNPGDYVGKNGIERAWEEELHGEDGGRQLEVDSRGRVLRVLHESQPTVGNSLVLTIDQRLQQVAERAFGSQAGAAVVMDVTNGEVLAFVSSPTFDPTLFSGKIPTDIWQGYLKDKRHPLQNKALSGQYPPGSTFKMITALAGLEAGLVNESSSVYCDGTYKLGSGKFRCWSRNGHGSVNLRRSLKESCDVYYYQLGERLGIDRLAEMCRRFKLGDVLGIGLSGEKKGLIPTTEWKLQRFGKRWVPGDTPPAAIGQGYVLMTPIQLVSMVATFANDGTIFRPHLVKRVVDADGKVLKEFAPEVLAQVAASPANFKKVKQGLFAVVNDPGGTGAAARLGDVRVAGKTGTSQVVKLGEDRKRRLAYEYQDHALFTAYAPYDKPEVAVAVVVEHGGGGGSVAAPIAGRILRAWFDLKKPAAPRQEPPEEDKKIEGPPVVAMPPEEQEQPVDEEEGR